MIDCGTDWLKSIPLITKEYKPEALLLTHAHPDHAGGIKKGSFCLTYASHDTIEKLASYPIKQFIHVSYNCSYKIADVFNCTPYFVEHSINAPAVGWKITDGTTTIFYVPDVAKIKDLSILNGVDYYIGDGAIITRSMLVRKKNHHITGHTSIKEQTAWCTKAGIKNMIITHCGTEIVKGNQQIITQKIENLGTRYKIHIKTAYDNMVMIAK
jgi:phosphoribosyl 1,2-cyclic phosphodiesterase